MRDYSMLDVVRMGTKMETSRGITRAMIIAKGTEKRRVDSMIVLTERSIIIMAAPLEEEAMVEDAGVEEEADEEVTIMAEEAVVEGEGDKTLGVEGVLDGIKERIKIMTK
jgi:hypothetical protein